MHILSKHHENFILKGISWKRIWE